MNAIFLEVDTKAIQPPRELATPAAPTPGLSHAAPGGLVSVSPPETKSQGTRPRHDTRSCQGPEPLYKRFPLAYDADDATPYIMSSVDLRPILASYAAETQTPLTDRQFRLLAAIVADPSWIDLVEGKSARWTAASLSAVTGIRTDHLHHELTTGAMEQIVAVDEIGERRGRYFRLLLVQSMATHAVIRETTESEGQGSHHL